MTRKDHKMEAAGDNETRSPEDACEVRRFVTGAMRTDDTFKLDPEGSLSPIALLRYCQYLHKHRFQADGTIRASDNWQRGMPRRRYMKALWRHCFDTWLIWRGFPHLARTDDIEVALCGVLFNAFGMLHEVLLGRDVPDEEGDCEEGNWPRAGPEALAFS